MTDCRGLSVAFRGLASLLAALAVAACQDTADTSNDCTARNHCHYNGDTATCDAGYAWAHPETDGDYHCKSTCNNGNLDAGEPCDADNLGGQSCISVGYRSGTLACERGCKGFDFSGCGAPASCGNGEVDTPEVCDGDVGPTVTCASLGLGTGSVTCLPNCGGYDTSACGSTTCTPECGTRVCGPDPICGSSCGSCSTGTCNSLGQCLGDDPVAPQFLSFSTNSATLTFTSTLVFTAVLTDPDGADDIVGGTLTPTTGSSSYGAFVGTGTPGSFTLSLTWSEVNDVMPIVAPTTAGVSRVFRAKFFDAAGHSVARDTTMTLKCGGTLAACEAGVCVDLQTDDDNCGQCGRAVPASSGVCDQGEISCYSPESIGYCGGLCIPISDDPNNCGACNRRCSEVASDASGTMQGCVGGACEVEVVSTAAASCASVCVELGLTCGWLSYDNHGQALYHGTGDCAEFWVPSMACDEVPETFTAYGYCSGDFASITCYCAG